MTSNIDRELQYLLSSAKLSKKGDFSVYNYYKGRIEELMLEPKECQQAIRELCKILKI